MGMPERVTIEIDLSRLFADGDRTLEEYIVGEAATRLLAFDGQAIGEFRRRALSIADEEIREALKPVVAQALEAAVQRTDTFGAPRGEPKSLREVIVESAIDQLRKPQGDGFSGTRRGETLVQFVIRKEVEEALGKDLRSAVQAARAQVLAAVQEKASEIITETIAKVAEGRRL